MDGGTESTMLRSGEKRESRVFCWAPALPALQSSYAPQSPPVTHAPCGNRSRAALTRAARCHEAPPERNDSRRRRAMRGNLLVAPDLQQLAVAHRHRCGIGLRRIAGPDAAAREHEVGLLGRHGERSTNEQKGKQVAHDGGGRGVRWVFWCQHATGDRARLHAASLP